MAIASCFFVAGCDRGAQLPAYEDERGFRMTPPPGWTERARPAGSGAAQGTRRSQANLPLPSLGLSGGQIEERMLVRYDRVTAGRLAWLRVTVANVPSPDSLEEYLKGRPPRPDWKRESDVEKLEVAGRPADRVVFRGRWNSQDYVNETVVVVKEGQAYFITASFPATDETGRNQVRKAIAGVTWR
jgi:hypothetical protein